MRLSYLLGLSLVLHVYVGARVVPTLPGGSAMAFAALLAASAVCAPMGMFARRLARPPVSDRLAAIGLFFMGMFSSMLVITFLRDVALLLLALVTLAAPGLLPMDAVRLWSGRAVPTLGLIVTFLGFWNARRTARVKTVDIPLAGLPAALHGFTIVQISDIHVGPTIRQRYVEGIVDAVNRLQPDLVAITGDLVDGSVLELGAQVAPLAGLVSRHGSFFVTGNHEYYAGADPWIHELRRLGINVLINQHVVIEHAGAQLILAGVADFTAAYFNESHRSDPGAALLGAPAGALIKILLAHQPRSAPAAAKAGFHLQLSGHTHGGQFLPWNFFVRFQQPFTAGLHRLGGLWIYVSRGTGYWGPPKRFGAPSEITRVRLKHAAV
jgi:predicted MPP superfamily phosphohydrolase